MIDIGPNIERAKGGVIAHRSIFNKQGLHPCSILNCQDLKFQHAEKLSSPTNTGDVSFCLYVRPMLALSNAALSHAKKKSELTSLLMSCRGNAITHRALAHFTINTIAQIYRLVD